MSFVAAASSQPHTGTWDSKNLLDPWWSTIVSYNPFGNTGSSGKQQGMFYTLDNWEIQACAKGVTDELSPYDPYGFASSPGLENVYAITTVINGYKSAYSTNETLYEISWYVQPKDGVLSYAIGLSEKNSYTTLNTLLAGKDILPNTDNLSADSVQGDVGYAPFTSEKNYTYAFIIDTKNKAVLWVAPIIQKPIGGNG